MASAGETPPERDVKDFRYQQLCRFQISEEPLLFEQRSPQLLAASSKYGIFFVGTNKGFKVIKTSELSRIDKEHVRDKTKVIIKEYPCVASIELDIPITYVGLSCDNLSLAVAVETEDLSQVYIYDVRSFVSQGNQISRFIKVPLSCGLADLAWNPEQAAMFVCVMVDGSIQILEAGNNLTIKASLTAQAKATCVCWSPKGKQLVVGQDDGILVQYDQALTKKKVWPCPDMLQGQQRVIGLTWLSTFSFMVAYIAVDAEMDDQPNIFLITGGKDVAPKYTPFEDPCFGGGEERQKKYFFNYLPNWEMITATSSTSNEIAVLGKHFDNKTDIERWNLDDAARAEIPLKSDHSEAYSMGVAIDLSSQLPLPLEDESILPPCPILLVLSSEGYLIPFYMVYTHPEVPVLTIPPAVLTSEGARQASAAPSVTAGTIPKQPAVPAGPSFQFVSTKPANTTATTGSTGSPFSLPSSLSDTSTKSAFGSSASGFNFGSDMTKTGSIGRTGSPVAIGSVGANGSVGAPGSFGTTGSIGKTDSPVVTGPVGAPGSFGTTGSIGRTGSPVTTSSVGTTGSIGAPGSFETTSSFGGTGSLGAMISSGITDSIGGIGSLGGTSSVAGTSSTNTSSFGQPANAGLSNLLKPQGKVGVQGQPSTSLSFTSPIVSKYVSTTTQADTTGFNLAAGSIKSSAPSPAQPATVTVAKPEPTKQVKLSRHQPSLPATSEVRQQITPQEDTVPDNLNSTFNHSIIEEMAHFEDELMKFRTKALANKVTVGSDREMENIKRKTEDLTNFSDEVKQNTKEQNKEIEDKKSLLLDSYSMVEDCKMREQRNCDPKYVHLLRSKTLDPANQERLRSLQQKVQILDQGLRECDTILHNQWEEYKNKNNRFTRMATPTTDLIYRSIKSNKNIILHQKQELDDLDSQLKQLRLYNKTSTWQDTLSESRSAELSSLADSLLESKTAPLSSTRISEPASPQKMARLREHLSRRSVPRIKSTRPENLSMSRIVSAERQAVASRSPAVPLQTEQPLSNGIRAPQQTGQSGLPSQMMTPFLQQQALNLTGSYIRFQSDVLQARPPTIVNKVTVGQPGMTGFGAGIQPSGTTFGNQPSGTAYGNQPSGTAYGNQPSGTAYGNQPSGTAYGNQPSGTAYGNQPSGTAYGNQPSGTAYGNQPSGTTFGNQSSGTAYGNQPGITTGFSEMKPTLGSIPVLNSGIEDITPPSSTGYEEDEEYEDTETDTNDEDYGEGFGPQYNMPVLEDDTSGRLTDNIGGGKKMASTPAKPDGLKTGAAVPSRNLFGSPKPPPDINSVSACQPFAFGNTTKETPGFAFGGSTNSNGGAIPKMLNSFSFTANNPPTPTEGAIPKTSNGFDFTASTSTTPKVAKVPSDSSFKFTLGNTSSPVAFKFGQSGESSFGTEETTPFSSTKPTTGFDFSTKTVTTEQRQASDSTGVEDNATNLRLADDDGDVETSNPASDVAKSTSQLNIDGTRSTADSSGDNSATALKGDKSAAGSFSFTVTSLTTSTTQNVTDSRKSTSGFQFTLPLTGGTAFNTSTEAGRNEQEASDDEGEVTQSSGGQPVTTATGSTVTKSLFGTTTPLIGQKPSSSSASTGLFGQSATSETGLFGQTASSFGTTGLFGKLTQVATDGQTTPPTTTGSGVSSESAPSTSDTVSTSSKTSEEQSKNGENVSSTTGGASQQISGSSSFGQSITTTSTGLFGQTSTSNGGLFGKPSTTATSLFGQTSSSSGTSLFGQKCTATSSGLFGQSTTSTTGSLFGQTATTSTGTSLFGQTATATTSAPTSFGQTTTASTSSPAPFGQTTTASTSAPAPFGQTTTASTSAPAPFGQTTTASTSAPAPFGQTTTASTSAPAPFGQPASVSTGIPAPFGQSTTASTSVPAPFGQGGVTASQSSSPFGQTSTSTSENLFMQKPSSVSGGLFGQPANPGMFGQPTSASSPAGLFGQPTASSSSSGLFGQTTPASGSSGLFGQSTATSGTNGPFGQPVSTPSTGGLFGQPASSGSAPFGQSTATSSGGGLFGQSSGGFGMGQTTSGAAFGQTAFGQTAFGQTSSSPFGQTATTSSSGGSTFGGSMFGGLGGQPSAERASTNVFGSTSFGSSSATSSASSLFGTQGSTTFGSNTSAAFGGGSFSGGGGGSVASSGFGVSTQQSSPGGFGAAPAFGTSPSFGGGGVSAFGAKPAFGSSPTFGGGSAFGGQPAFGSPVGGGGGFGSPQSGQAPGFAGFAGTSSNATFEALAGSSSVPTFGSLSQGTGGGGFGTSPGFGTTGTQSPGFGGGGFGTNPQPGFGTTTPPNNPSFTGYRS